MEIHYGNQDGWFKVVDGLEHGRGIIVARNVPIPAWTPLNLFPRVFGSRTIPLAGISKYLLDHGVEKADGTVIVPHFDTPEQESLTDEVGWFLNHSAEPNVCHDPLVHPSLFIAARDLEPGDELLIDYMYLREPNTKSYYYHPIPDGVQYQLPALV